MDLSLNRYFLLNNVYAEPNHLHTINDFSYFSIDLYLRILILPQNHKILFLGLCYMLFFCLC